MKGQQRPNACRIPGLRSTSMDAPACYQQSSSAQSSKKVFQDISNWITWQDGQPESDNRLNARSGPFKSRKTSRFQAVEAILRYLSLKLST